MIVSVSKINAFRTCKYKYRLAYIDGVEQEQSPSLKKGSDVHKALENLSADGVLNPIVVNFFKSNIGKKYLNLILTSQHEACFGLKVKNGVVPCDFDDPDAFFHGIIDVLSGNTILDYKTGKKKTFEAQDWKQLMFYAAWLFLAHPEYNEVYISYLYIEHDYENALTVNRVHLNSILKKLLSSVSEIANYTKNPTDEHIVSPLCDYCGCRKYCRFYNALVSSRLENIQFETPF